MAAPEHSVDARLRRTDRVPPDLGSTRTLIRNPAVAIEKTAAVAAPAGPGAGRTNGAPTSTPRCSQHL
jgi:hypothetical protein